MKQEIASAELNTQHHTFSGLLNKINSGMMVINSNNVIRFANEKAYSILSTQETKDQLTDLLRYRASTDDSVIELKPKMGEGLHIRASNLIWDGERANLFVLNPFKIDEEKHDAFLNDVNFSIMLGSIAENVLLLKDNKVVFANKPALGKLRMNSKEIAEKTFEEIIETKENLFEALTIESLLAEKGFAGFLKLSDSPAQKAKFFIKAVNLSGKFYRLLTFEEEREEQRVPKQRTDSELFSTEGVLHMASHDLREPVRTILNYVQLISENLGNKKYEQAIEYADFAKAAAGRMDKLLSDLKTYVALSEHPFELSRVSMKNAVSDVLKQMKRKIEDEKAEISFAELPEVNADRQLVEKLLFQLVDNAILFHRKEKIPVIDIGYDKFENNYIFCVRDNGIGISKKYYQKIFEPFERLNRVDEYPGNGLGLAICKKIVEIHGGEIWVESLPGSGSNFYFTLKGSRV